MAVVVAKSSWISVEDKSTAESTIQPLHLNKKAIGPKWMKPPANKNFDNVII